MDRLAGMGNAMGQGQVRVRDRGRLGGWYASIDGARLGQVRYVGRCWCMVIGEVEVVGEVMVDRREDRDVEEDYQ